MRGNKKLFLSAVSSELASYRNLLAADLKRPNLDVAVQEDFVVGGGTTLEKLDTYILHCDAVIHLIGKAAGAVPEGPAVATLLAKYPDLGARLPPLAEALRKPQPGFSYTQWEAYLGLYHRRPLFVYRPTDFELDAFRVPPDARFAFSPSEAQSQKEHYRRISALAHDRGQFLNEERLSSAVLRDLVEILPRLEATVHVTPTKLRHTAERLIGRDEDLSGLDAAWNDPHKNVVIVRAFGGMGKTSLVATWMAELALKNWRGAARVFDWSFYSQGTREQSAASADTFMAEALRAFGDPDPMLGSPWDRGARLAGLVSKSRCLLVLDGLEPLQHPPGPMEGQLKDAGLSALLKGLAAQNAGLCVVATREKVDDIKQHYGRTADDVELTRLTDLAGAALLYDAGARRAGAMAIAPDDKDLRAASREVRGHGLTLHLLGRYLRLVEDGDICKRDTVRLADADEQYQNDATRPYGHAFKAMEAYEKWFAGEGDKGLRQLAILRLLGLFDRPASKTCLDALRAEPLIAGLTEALVGLNPRKWKLALSRLKEINLLAVQDDGSVDCHPLLREYFATQLRRQQPEVWRAAHRRLYEHLCATTSDKKPNPTLEDLQPLYQAVAHGCQAENQCEAFHDVFVARIARVTSGGKNLYSINRFGAFGEDLAAMRHIAGVDLTGKHLTRKDRAEALNFAGHCLRACGRLAEAVMPLNECVNAYEGLNNLDDSRKACIAIGTLSQILLTIGELATALNAAKKGVTLATEIEDDKWKLRRLAYLGDVLHQMGRINESRAEFEKAALVKKRDEGQPLLDELAGYLYSDLLLTQNERDAVAERTTRTLALAKAERETVKLTVGLDSLALGRVEFQRLQTSRSGEKERASAFLNDAVENLIQAGAQHHLPRGFLARAAFYAWRNDLPRAQADLDEAWEIAERGPMKLFMADIHLHRARLFFREAQYPWGSPAADLAAAEKLIHTCGYHRRDEELADARKAIIP